MASEKSELVNKIMRLNMRKAQRAGNSSFLHDRNNNNKFLIQTLEEMLFLPSSALL